MHKQLYVSQGQLSAQVSPADMVGIAQGQAVPIIRTCHCSRIAASMQASDLAADSEAGTHLQHPGGRVEPLLQAGHTRNGLKVVNEPATLLAQVTL